MDKPAGAVNSVEYWDQRFFEDWIAKGGRRQTAFFAELCVRELPPWFVEEVRARRLSIFDYGCAVGDALPVLRGIFPESPISGGDVARVGLGLARALYPDFAFADLNEIDPTGPLADIVYCSNTLEHFADWRPVLDRLARHAKEYVVVVVPFEEEDLIEEHFVSFEFDSLPARLPAGNRLLHLGVVDAALEPGTEWKGFQLIAIYGGKVRRRDRRSPRARAIEGSSADAWPFDLRGVKPSGMAPVLAGLKVMSQARQRLANRAAALQAETERLTPLLAQVETAYRGAIREYADLARSTEEAQRFILHALAVLDPDLIAHPQITPVPEAPSVPAADDDAAQRETIARLIATAQRANMLALFYHDRATNWKNERAALTERLGQTRRALEHAVGERDHAFRGAPAAPQPEAAPLVSIVLPVYNQAYLVDEAIAGILSQTYQNWELIVVDDGSTDDLADRVRRHLGDRRVLFLRQPNQRLPAALNHGFAEARGELLTWTSADNIMLPAQLERLVAELAAHPEASLAYSDYWAIDDKGDPLDQPLWRPHNRDLHIADLIRLPDSVTIENFHRSGDNFIGASFLYRRAAADIVGPYADDTFGGEDYDFWLRLHLVAEFRHVAEPLYKYRVHADTLTARAEDLGLYDNIRELLEADRWRIETLIADSGLKSGASPLRPVTQFHPALLHRCRPLAYHEFAARDPGQELPRPVLVDVEVPLRQIDPAVLRPADIVLCRSEPTAELLHREDWARGKRVLSWQGELTQAVQHAYIQAFADQVTAPVVAPPRRVPARIDDAFRPTRILLQVDRWSSGGMETIVADLAGSLAADGKSVIVAAAQGAPPPPAAFRDRRIRTLSLHGDESAFEALLRREAIDIVNYHHSSFAVATTRGLAVASVYTMHNCYLWMDEAARAQVAAGLTQMDRVVAVSRQVAQFASAQFGVPADRMVVVPNGLRDSILATAPRRSIGSGPFTVLMVGSFSRLKLQHIAIAAFCEAAEDIPGMRLRLIGAPLHPEYQHELEAQIAASPVGNRIELVAGLSRTDTVAAMAAAQVFLLPSLVEGCSMALLEATAAGCVAIATDVGNARELQDAGYPLLLLPSPLGELDQVTREQFLAAAAEPLPEHQKNVATALRQVWRDYGSLVASALEGSARLREVSSMAPMTDAYLRAYTLAARGGPARRPSDAAASAILAPA